MDDALCFWNEGYTTGGFASVLIIARPWRVVSPQPGVDVITVLSRPGAEKEQPIVRFEIRTVDGEVVLIAEDGTRLARVRR
jgi:hypothetical protein